MLFDKVIAFDNIKNKIILIVNVKTDNLRENYKKAIKELARLKKLIQKGKQCKIKRGRLKSEFRQLFDKEQFCSMVEKAKDYIKVGDIFQVILSNRFDADYDGDLLNTYRTLRTINPSPYKFYFGSNDLEIAGASPETLVKLTDGHLYTFPLAGTRPRGKNREEDEKLEKELLSDEKELAEHNMLVDLGRNDIGRVADLVELVFLFPILLRWEKLFKLQMLELYKVVLIFRKYLNLLNLFVKKQIFHLYF